MLFFQNYKDTGQLVILIGKVFNPFDIFNSLNIGDLHNKIIKILGMVYIKIDGALENIVMNGDVDISHVNFKLRGNNLCDIIDQPDTVYSRHTDPCKE